MTKDQLAFSISLAMHNPRNASMDATSECLKTYKCLCNYFQDLSMDDIAGIASRYGVMA